MVEEHELMDGKTRPTDDIILEHFRPISEYEQALLKSSFLINGGAAIALLAFIGSIDSLTISLLDDLNKALLHFTGGVLFSAMSLMTGYMAACYIYLKNKAYMIYKVPYNLIMRVYFWLTLILIISSFGMFWRGTILASNAFKAL